MTYFQKGIDAGQARLSDEDERKKKKRLFLLLLLLSLAGGLLVFLASLLFGGLGGGGKNYTVTFRCEYSDGREETVHTRVVDIGGLVDEPGAPAANNGQQFKGWYETKSATNPIRFPYRPTRADVILWGRFADVYTIRFHTEYGADWSQSADSVSPIVLKAPDYNAADQSFRGWYTSENFDESTRVNDLTVITGNTDFYAKWVAVYTVSFNMKDTGASAIDPVRVLADVGNFALPAPAALMGKAFDKWYADSALMYGAGNAGALYSVYSDITLYAGWVEAYTITLATNGGGSIPLLTVRKDDPVLRVLPDAMRTPAANWAFDGWYTDNGVFHNRVTPPNLVSSDMTLYAKWTAVYTVTFDARGGTGAPAFARVRADSSLSELPDARYEGRTFTGWYSDPSATGVPVLAPYTAESHVTLYAGWVTGRFAVLFNTNGGATLDPRGVSADGGTILLPVPTRAGAFEFGGWYTDDGTFGNRASEPYAVYSTHTLYAKWEVLYTVTFVFSTGSSPPPIKAIANSFVELPRPSPEGYDFDGWYANNLFTGQSLGDYYTVTGNVYLFGKLTPRYTVTFSTKRGAPVYPSVVVRAGENLTANQLSQPSGVSGYIFAGWYRLSSLTGARITAADPIVMNMTLYAAWNDEYILTFVSELGAPPVPLAVVNGQGAVPLSPPQYDGNDFNFAGWYDNENFTGSPVAAYPSGTYQATRSVVLYAKWQFRVTFDTYGIANVASQNKDRGATGGIDAAPNTDGWKFLGWYVSSSETGTFNESDKVSDYSELARGSLTLYAKWQFTVTFNVNGIGDAPASKTLIKGSWESLPSPSRANAWTFGGWYKTNGVGGAFAETSKVIAYSAVTNGETTLYAKWVYRITYDLKGVAADKDSLFDGETSVGESIVKGKTGDMPKPTVASQSWKFAGWFKSFASPSTFSGEVKTYRELGAAVNDGDITLYAKWTYEVGYVLNGVTSSGAGNILDGNSDAVTVSATRGSADALLRPRSPAWSFVDWYRNSDFTNSVTTYSQLNAGDVTLYGRWRFSVTFELNGVGTLASPSVVTKEKGATGSFDSPAGPAGENYDFRGWFRNNSFAAADAVSDYSALTDGNVRLYAYWHGTFRLTYNVNGVGSTPAPLDITGGNSEITLPALSDAAGYKFDGWYNANPAVGGDFDPANKVSSPYRVIGSQTLYARWTFKVTFDLNDLAGSSLPSTQITRTKGASQPVPSEADAGSPAGWLLDGWYKSYDSSTGAFADKVSDYDELTGDVTLYARWQLVVVFVMNGVGAQLLREFKDKGATDALTVPAATTGWTFGGWYTQNGEYGAFADAYKVTAYRDLNGGATLYARWTFAVTYNYNISGRQPVTENVNRGGIGELSKGAANDWTFAGWFKSFTAPAVFSGEVTRYDDLTSGDINLYAKWTYKVEFVNNGIGAAQADITAVVKDAFYTALPSYADLGSPAAWAFDGWYKENAFTTSKITNLNQLPDGNAVLYAKWQFTVTFDANGAGIAPSAQTLAKGDGAAVPEPSGKPANYTWNGWYTQNAAAANEWTWGAKVSSYSQLTAGGATLYGRWDFTVTFDTRGEGTVGSITAFKGEPSALPAPAANNYDFGGWYKTFSAPATYSDSAAYYSDLTAGNVTLYARWTFSVKFVNNGRGASQADRTVAKGDSSALPSMSQAGFAFGGWYLDNSTFLREIITYDNFNGASGVGKIVTVYAQWTYGVVTDGANGTDGVNDAYGDFAVAVRDDGEALARGDNGQTETGEKSDGKLFPYVIGIREAGVRTYD